MKLNPIVKRDLTVGSRNTRLTAVIMSMNAVLFAVGILGLFGRLAAFRLEQSINCRGTLAVYAVTAAVLFVLVLFLFPAMTTGSISSETAGGTLDLMLASGMTPGKIVLGKFLGRLIPAMVLLFSFLPSLVLPLIYGGVGFEGCLELLLLFVPFAVMLLSVGLFASAAGKNGGLTALTAYGIILGITVLPVLLAFLTAALAETGRNRFAYLMAGSPLITIGAKLLSQLGESDRISRLFLSVNLQPAEGFYSSLIWIGVLVQLLLSLVFLGLAVISTAPGRGKRK